jgi:sigma-B regulation protein RsbU (phosphoserine phosphatase)
MQTIEQISHYIGEIMFGTFFMLTGLTAAGIAMIRRGKGFRILVWLAVWSFMYGARLLLLSPPVRILLPQVFEPCIPYIDVAISYLIVVFALLAWLDLTRDKMRFFMQIMIIAGMSVGLAGISWFIVCNAAETFMIYNNLLATCTLLVLVIVVSVRKLSDKFLVLPNRGILATGTLLFAAEALYSNLSRFFLYKTWPILGWLGFVALLFSLAFTAAKMIFASERRLFALENELETARKIQFSILPTKIPELHGLSIAATYHPMLAVAGDYYEFIQINQHQAGFLVADVSGHGIPAALIASMIKVAMQTVISSAKEPGEVLRLLGNILGNQLHDGQFVTAAYLYVDSKTSQARYSSAGHPPLLYWDSAARQVQFIESNGLLIGFSNETDYPVREFSFKKGDRFILYTDGLTEAENQAGEFFGDHCLSELIHKHKNIPAKELNEHILNGLKLWQRSQMPQQDDITWIIVDII